MSRSLRLALAGLLALLAGAAAAGAAIPPVARVTDLSGTLDAGQQRALSARLAQFEQATGAQLAVLVLPSTRPETIEQYGIRLAETWKLGRKGVDDGAILIVAKNDHRLRIEVGYGLEGAIPDAVARRIIDDTIVPAFKAGDYYGGIDAGVGQIMRAAQGENLAAPQKSAAQLAREQADQAFLEQQDAALTAQMQRADRQGNVLIVISSMVFCAIFGLAFSLGLYPWLGKSGAALFAGLLPGLAGYFLARLVHLPGLVLALPGALLVFLLSRAAIAGAKKNMAAGRGSGGRGYTGGGSSSSYSSSSSSSSDSFSGGGGGFGGGGASGSW